MSFSDVIVRSHTMQLDALHMRGEVALIFRGSVRVAALSQLSGRVRAVLWDVGSGACKGRGRLVQNAPGPTAPNTLHALL